MNASIQEFINSREAWEGAKLSTLAARPTLPHNLVTQLDGRHRWAAPEPTDELYAPASDSSRRKSTDKFRATGADVSHETRKLNVFRSVDRYVYSHLLQNNLVHKGEKSIAAHSHEMFTYHNTSGSHYLITLETFNALPIRGFPNIGQHHALISTTRPWHPPREKRTG